MSGKISRGSTTTTRTLNLNRLGRQPVEAPPLGRAFNGGVMLAAAFPLAEVDSAEMLAEFTLVGVANRTLLVLVRLAQPSTVEHLLEPLLGGLSRLVMAPVVLAAAFGVEVGCFATASPVPTRFPKQWNLALALALGDQSVLDRDLKGEVPRIWIVRT